MTARAAGIAPGDRSGRAERNLFASAALVAALMLPTLVAYAIDTRQLHDINVWIKPLKFQASIVLYVLTLVAFIRLLREDVRGRKMVVGSASVCAAAAVFEIGYIVFQAARGRKSHYNFDTPLESALYGVMGVGALALLVPAVVVGWLVLRYPRPDLGAGLRLGVVLGLKLGTVLMLITAGYLSSQSGHWIGGELSDASGLPVTGWSTTGGDLRVAHFLCLHMFQLLPLVGWLGDRHWPSSARRVVIVTAVVWTALVAATFVQALLGRPLVGA